MVNRAGTKESTVPKRFGFRMGGWEVKLPLVILPASTMRSKKRGYQSSPGLSTTLPTLTSPLAMRRKGCARRVKKIGK